MIPNISAGRGSGLCPNMAVRKTGQNDDGCIPRPVLHVFSDYHTARSIPCLWRCRQAKVSVEPIENFAQNHERCPRVHPSLSTTPFLLQEVAATRIAAFVQYHHPSFEQNPEARGSSNAVRIVCVVTAVKLTFLVRLSQPLDGRLRDTVLAVHVIASIIRLTVFPAYQA